MELGNSVIGDLVTEFIERSGGIEKVEEVLNAIRKVPLESKADFIRASAKTDPGARQLCAAAMLGFTMAVWIHNTMEKEHVNALRPTRGNA